MTITSHSTQLIVGILVALLAASGAFDALGQQAARSQPATDVSIVELLKQRRAVLEQLVKAQTEAYQHGEASMEGMAQAQQELVQVKLELATTDNERVKLLEESIELARAFEKLAGARYRAAEASKVDVFRAEAATLKAEFDLLRERQKAKNDTDVGAERDSRIGKADPGTPSSARSMTRRSTLILRSAAAFANKLREARSELELARGLQTREFQAESIIKGKEEQLSILRAELEAQLSLLELEVEDAQRAVAASTKHLELIQEAVGAGLPESKLIEAQSAADDARSRLRRARTLLDLYGKIDETGGTTPAASASSPQEAEGTTPFGPPRGENANATNEEAQPRQRKTIAEGERKGAANQTEIWAMDADGTNAHRVAFVPGYPIINSPEVSPDGKWVAVDGWKRGENLRQARLLLVNLESGVVRNLGEGAMPNWRPDGKWIAYCRYGDERGVYIGSIESNDEQLIDRAGWGIQWSPDGSKLAYSRASKIVVYDMESHERHEVVPASGWDYKYIYWNLTWSADSREICFKARHKDGHDEFAILRATTNMPVVRRRVNGDDFHPDIAWHPDGSRVLIPGKAGNGRPGQIYEFNANTETKPKRLAGQPSERHNGGLCWSRDGKTLYFVSRGS